MHQLEQPQQRELRTEADDAAAFSTEEREMLRRLLRFGGLRVDDIMVLAFLRFYDFLCQADL